MLIKDLQSWKDLEAHAGEMRGVRIADLFEEDGGRFEKFHIRTDTMLADYSKHCFTDVTLDLLEKFAQDRGFAEQKKRFLSGEKVNVTEDRAAYHIALRDADGISDQGVADVVRANLAKMQGFSERVRKEGKITDVIHVGVGGSDLAPRMVYRAFEEYRDGPRVHFLSNHDPASLEGLLGKIDPEKTLVLLVSKSFKTYETISIGENLRNKFSISNIVAITNDIDAALAFGCQKDAVFFMPDWVGGRFSVWSAAGLSLCLAFGFEKFQEFLSGAQDADENFSQASGTDNIAYRLALVDFWNRNFMRYCAQAILPYKDSLRYFPAYVQQISMESNGKASDIETSPVVFGDIATNSQHAFMQHLHQSAQITPAEFILFLKSSGCTDLQKNILASGIAQAQALMEGQENTEEPHRHFPGNRPSTMLVLKELSFASLGYLMAVNEHRVFVLGVLWGINSFDQFGVELGKYLTMDIEQQIQGDVAPSGQDSSTTGLIDIIKRGDF